MKTETIEIEDLAESFILSEDADGCDWPMVEITVGIEIHPAEPDVGLFEPQIEASPASYSLDGIEYATEDAFIAALYERIADDIEEDETYVRGVINTRFNTWVEHYEGPDDDDRDDRHYRDAY